MSGEKTLDPTRKKLADSRKEGQVATSTDFLRTATAIVTFEGCRHLVIRDADRWTSMLQTACDYAVSIGRGDEWSIVEPAQWIMAAVAVSAFFLTAVVFLWVVLSWVQTGGPVLVEHPIAFKIDKLDPSNYFKNVFSMKTLTTFAGNTFKSTLLSVLFIYAVWVSFVDFHQGMNIGLTGLLTLIGNRATHFIRLSLWLMLAISCFDIWIQIRMLHKTLRMSHQDVKDEHKGMEGNAEVKQQVREIGNELLGQDGPADPLNGSNALIVNPTHIAVGLFFSDETKTLPLIRVKKVEHGAMDLIDLAHSKAIPVIRHLWLARTLYVCSVGRPVPRETYKTVAAIYRVIVGVRAGETLPR
jgi:type III secretion protein U